MAGKDPVHLDPVSNRNGIKTVAFDQIDQHASNIAIVLNDQNPWLGRSYHSKCCTVTWLLRGRCHIFKLLAGRADLLR
ncbi:hypothetical protein AGR4A_pAt30042 [Agrobacterium tumefaciens str. B6]|uniref:Uncharacterized protein n=1 Tax=Agrobacterium tumefaciens str. B6 TaxID=1183423 RepID=A0A822VCK1_AGRTU|nr:hypothetical protein AGR4A_pAt30042 [Agrobacterium tumefaciens str. B6]